MSIVLIFDCGATNLRTIAINQKGEILAAQHLPNCTKTGAESAEFHIWDFDEIWQKLQICAAQTLAQLQDLNQLVAIGVTTFGVDGAPFDKQGNPLYPIISWKCPRTLPVMQTLAQELDIRALYQRNGIGQYRFNTLFKLRWLKDNKPDIYAQMDKFVFISAMIAERLSGEFCTDRTMAGTSMMTNLHTGDWDDDVLKLLSLNKSHFPPMRNAGEIIGELKAEWAKQWNVAQVPIISCGHDTQFAVFGSGASLNQPVLSSGTWEILMARTLQAKPDYAFISQGLTTEFDAIATQFNPAVQWVGSGILEWLGKLLFADVANTDKFYSTMIAEGTQAIQNAPIHAKFENTFAEIAQGTLSGLSMFSSRGEIYAAALQFMANQLKAGLSVLQQVSQFHAQRLICVGGGSKNALWNQLRANTLNLPIDVVEMSETTVLGAAMFCFSAAGIYASPDAAQQAMRPPVQRVYPNS